MNHDCPTCCNEAKPKHKIYGTLTYHNGIVINWLRFIDKSFTIEAAREEAKRIVLAENKGMGIESIAVN